GAVEQLVVDLVGGQGAGEVADHGAVQGEVLVHDLVGAAVPQEPVADVGAVAGVLAQPLDQVDLAPAAHLPGHPPPLADGVLDQVGGGDGGVEGELVVPGQGPQVVQVVLVAGDADERDGELERVAVGGVGQEPAGVPADL